MYKFIKIIFLFQLILNQDNCANYCNECDRVNNRCLYCTAVQGTALRRNGNACLPPLFFNTFATCSTIIFQNISGLYTCLASLPEIQSPENCRIIDPNFKCTYCITDVISGGNLNYYLDTNTYKCVQVTTRIVNCMKYKDSQTCIECAFGYIVSSNKCVRYYVSCPIVEVINGKCNTCYRKNGVIEGDTCWIFTNILNLSAILFLMKFIL